MTAILLTEVNPRQKSNPPQRGCSVVKAIHTEVVDKAIDNFSRNRVLDALPPLINPYEKLLPRQIRSVLCQLRSGHCARLKDFLFRLGRVDDDHCPSCHGATHSVSHIFECPSHPTSLSTSDLWERPWDVATFLLTLPSFDFLPCPGPPPPPPRRRPRRRPPPDPPPLGGQS